jgi:urease
MKIISGGNNLCQGLAVNVGHPPDGFVKKLKTMGFCHREQPSAPVAAPSTMDRRTYAQTFGPTVGDRVRLGDTDLVVEIEYDLCAGPGGICYGDEVKFGGGKVLRDGLGQASGLVDKDVVDTVITNAVILDYTGIYKADVGIKHGKIVGIGKAGNPDTMDHVDPNLQVGVTVSTMRGVLLLMNISVPCFGRLTTVISVHASICVNNHRRK